MFNAQERSAKKEEKKEGGGGRSISKFTWNSGHSQIYNVYSVQQYVKQHGAAIN